jgi:arylsulfatase A-like enzyme
LVAKALALAAVVAAAAGCRPSAAPPRSPEPEPRGPWLVTIVVDQLAAWIADERWPLLPATGGFARLRREGLVVRELRFAHACTDTAPGHAALFSGATPNESGLVANETLGPNGRKVSILADPGTRLLVAGRQRVSALPGSSLAALRVETLADTLMTTRPDARVVSISLKDRGALPPAGRHPTLALWLDPELDAFVTSTAFAEQLPGWVDPLADTAAVQRARAAPWVPLAPDWLAAHAETPDDQPGEGDVDGLGTTFPHHARTAKAERATPAGDELVLALGRAAAAAAEADAPGRPLLLSLSLSSHDYIAHVFGPNSWEAWDELLRLDRGIGELMTMLDRLVGPTNYAVMLAGDHGSSPLPEVAGAPGPWCRRPEPDHWQRPCSAGRRLQSSELTAALEEVAASVLEGPGPWIAGIAEPYVYLTQKKWELSQEARGRLVHAAAATLRERFGVADLVDVRGAATDPCPRLDDGALAALVCRSVRQDAPGDLYVVPRPGTFFDPGYAPGHGANHGSPYLYDRAVPLIVRAPRRVAPGVRETPVDFRAFAHTAASLLGVPPPRAANLGADLTQAGR